MSLTKFDTLIDEFPEEAVAINRLLDLVRQGQSRSAHLEYRPNRLYDELQPSNYRVLVQILASAADKGLLKRTFRVFSRSGGGIGDFDSILDIPPEIYDSRIDRRVEVSPDDIQMIFIIEQ